MRLFSFRLVPFAAVCALLGAAPVLAQSPDDNVVTRPLDSDAQPLKKGRVTPQAGEAAGQGGEQGPGDGARPLGLSIYDRMGADLPPLPPEKAFKGKVDEAFGAFQRGYYMTAMDKALPRAQLGDPAAQTLLGEIISQGLGVKKDPKAAAFWYGQAAQNGDPVGMFRYALILMEGRAVPRDRKKADELMKKAADAGNASAQFNHAQVLVADNPGERGLELALPYYEKSAAQGIADAQYAVSQLYMALPSVGDEKRKEARQWLVRAARAGFDTAELDMGIWLVNGVGGERDYEDGFNWLSVAAKHGNVVAQNKLAHLYVNGIGTKADPIEAGKWYVLSRRAGLSDPKLEDFYLGLAEDQQKKAIEAANRFRRS